MKSVLSALALCALAACATITPIPYDPNPARVGDAATEARQIILANVMQGCIAEIEIGPTMMTVKFVCSSGVGNYVMRFDKVDTITLSESGGWYRVLVSHKDGIAPFRWTSRSLDDMKRLADALTALSSAKPAPAPAAAGTTT
jgi:hypothetical protein